MNVYDTLKQMNLELPAAPAKGGVYSPAKRFGKGLVYVSGCGPVIGEPVKGKLGQEFSVEQGQAYARACMLNMLAVLHDNIGDLNKVTNCVKLLVMVAGTPEFYDQPAVANGASQLLVDLYGAADAPSRSAVGMASLPGNIPVEIEGIFEIEE